MKVSRYLGTVALTVALSAAAHAQSPSGEHGATSPAQPNVVIINPAASGTPAVPATAETPASPISPAPPQSTATTGTPASPASPQNAGDVSAAAAPSAPGTPQSAAVAGTPGTPVAIGSSENAAAVSATAAPPSSTPAGSGSAPSSGSAAESTPAATGAATSAAASGPSEVKAEAVAPPPPPEPTLHIDIDLGTQRMTVSEHGAARFTWPISSARYGYRTPTGTFQPTWMAKMWYSRQYDYAPMPHAIFFSRGTAIHATYETRKLGRPASHGCVRLAPANAATLFKLVGKHGKGLTRVVVHGTPNHGPAVAERRERSRTAYARRPYYAYEPYYYAYDAPYYVPRPPRGAYYVKPRRYVQKKRRYYGGYGYGYGYGYGF